MRKCILPFLLVATSLGAGALIHITEHEEAHYEKGLEYNLNPKMDLLGMEVVVDTPESEKVYLSFIGSGFTAEQRLNRELSLLRVPNDLYSMIHLYTFANENNPFHRCKDGEKYFKLVPDERKKVHQAVKVSPFIFLAQVYFNEIDSPFFVHGWTEIDSRGVVSFYEITYSKSF